MRSLSFNTKSIAVAGVILCLATNAIGADSNKSIEGNGTTNTTSQPPPNKYAAGGTGGASDSAKGAGLQQLVGVGASAVSAAILYQQCASQKNYALCAMATMSVAQGLSLLGNSKGSKDAAGGMSTFDWGGAPTGTTTTTTNVPTVQGPGTYDPNNPGGGPDPNNPTVNTQGTTPTSPIDKYKAQLDGLKKGLAEKGYKLSPDGKMITGPDGKSVPTSAFGSDAGMKSAGFSDAEIEAAKAAASKAAVAAQNQIKAISMQAEGGGGGGSGAGGGGYGSGGSGSGSGFNMKMPWDKDKEKDKNKISGMSKKLGNDNIGVAGDNIFEMISRRYKVRDDQNNFLK